MRESRQRNGRSSGRLQINILQGFRRLLKLRCNFHHHVILVQRPVHRRDLPLSEGIVERIVEGLRRNSHPARRIAVDHQFGLQSFVLLIRVLVAQFGQRPHLREQSRGPCIKVVEVCALQSVLILRIAESSADGQVLRRLQDQCRSRHDREFSAQPVDHVVGAHAFDRIPRSAASCTGHALPAASAS